MTKRIFGLLAIIGLFVAVCTADGSENELLFRAGGTAAFGIFSYLWRWASERETIREFKEQDNEDE